LTDLDLLPCTTAVTAYCKDDMTKGRWIDKARNAIPGACDLSVTNIMIQLSKDVLF
ncbi:hypothetical protein V2G26_012190, partial [Clonostachys chloroleuca]